MRPTALAALLAAASLAPLAACEPAAAAGPVAPAQPAAAASADQLGPPAASRGAARPSPQERAVLAAMAAFKRAVVESDTLALKRIWTEDYTFVNPAGALVTRAGRLANFASGATNVDVIDAEREVTVRVYGDMAVVQNLSTLRARFGGRPTDTDLRGTFVWVRRGGRWQLATNQLTPVVP